MVGLDSWRISSIVGLGNPVVKVFFGFSIPAQAFAVFMGVDFVIGSWNAHLKGEFRRGLIVTKLMTKLIAYLSLLVLAYYVSLLSGATIFHTLVMGILLSKEGLSILDHSVELGVFRKAELGGLQDFLERIGNKKN